MKSAKCYSYVAFLQKRSLCDNLIIIWKDCICGFTSVKTSAILHINTEIPELYSVCEWNGASCGSFLFQQQGGRQTRSILILTVRRTLPQRAVSTFASSHQSHTLFSGAGNQRGPQINGLAVNGSDD